MKTLILGLAILLTAGAAVPLPPGPTELFGHIGADYKKPLELTDTFFNPFKNLSAGAASARREAASITNEAVTTAIAHRGVSGLVMGAEPQANRIVVGDQVFSLGDELTFPDGEKEGATPLIAGASVVLREVGRDHLRFDVTPEGELPRRVLFPLRAFWRF